MKGYRYLVLILMTIFLSICFFGKESIALNSVPKIVEQGNDGITKEELYLEIIKQKEEIIKYKEERATDLYNILMWVVAFFGVVVAVGVGFGTYYGYQIKKHQDKIDLVLESKKFDEKLRKIEGSLDKLQKFETRYNIESIKNNYYNYISKVQKQLGSVGIAYDKIPPEVLADYQYYKDEYEKAKKAFEEFKYDLEEEVEEDEMPPEEEIAYLLEDVKAYGDELVKLHLEIGTEPPI